MNKTTIFPGDKFGRLIAIKEETKKHNRYWLFKCECGKESVKRLTMVINGQTRSCGCLRKTSWRKKW